jgi:hypothetical protein
MTWKTQLKPLEELQAIEAQVLDAFRSAEPGRYLELRPQLLEVRGQPLRGIGG